MGTKFVTGLAKGNSGYDVGKAAAQQALQKLDTNEINFTIVFSSSKYNYEEVIKGIREITHDAPLIGCSTAGEFTENFVEKESIACALISSDNHKFFTGIGTGLREDEITCIREASKNFPFTVDGYPYKSYILCEDGLCGKGEETAMAMLSVLGANMKFAGGSAGDDIKMLETKVFSDNKVLNNSLSLALIASKKPIAIAVRHGHTPISPPLTVTKSDGNTVYEINNKPAFEIWKTYTREDAKKTLGIDVDNLQEHSENLARFLTRYGAGLYVGDSSYKIRWAGSSVSIKGPITFTTSIPENTVLRIMASPKEDQIASARMSAEIIKNSLKGMKLAGVIVFDCVVRAVILQDDFKRAVNAISEVLQAPLIGFETYGEFAMEMGQMSGFHNTTTVILALPD